MSYIEPSVRVVNTLRTAYKDGPFKAVFDGDPYAIPRHLLPAICVVQMNDSNSVGDSQSDEVACEIQIRVVFDKRPDFGVKKQEDDLTDRRIRDIVEERDATTGRYLENTLKNILRSRLELDPESWLRRDMRFELGSMVRPGGQGQDILTAEGVLTITIVYPVDIADMT